MCLYVHILALLSHDLLIVCFTYTYTRKAIVYVYKHYRGCISETTYDVTFKSHEQKLTTKEHMAMHTNLSRLQQLTLVKKLF